MANSKNRDIINKDIYEYNKDDIVNHEDIIEKESKIFYLNYNNKNYSNKIKANEEEVGTLLNQESKAKNSKVLLIRIINNNNLMLMYSKKNNTNNLDKIEIYFNEQDKIKEANKKGKSNIKKKEKNNIFKYVPSNNAIEDEINNIYNCHEHIIAISHMKFEFIDKFDGILFAIMSYFPKSIIIGNYDDLEYFWSYDNFSSLFKSHF